MERQGALVEQLSSALGQAQLVGLGALVGFIYLAFACRRDGTSVLEAVGLYSICCVAAAVGGRAWSVAEALGQGAQWTSRVLDPFQPAGYASLGGIVGAAFVLGAFRLTRGAELTWRLLDVVIPAGVLALAGARLGCLVEGCDFGAPWEHGVTFAAPHAVWQAHAARDLGTATSSAPVHPFPAYIALPAAGVSLGATLWRGPAGLRGLFVASAYFAIRFAAEFARDPATGPAVLGVFNVAQLFSAFAFGALVAAFRRRSASALASEGAPVG